MDTPCICDEDMSEWMEYLHMQNPLPQDAMGVQITLDVIDDNGNYRNIGTATSDLAGKYHLVWEPDIPGEYTIARNCYSLPKDPLSPNISPIIFH